MLRPYGKVVASPYEVMHTEQSIRELIDRIGSLEGEARVVMEATGAYHLPLLETLKSEGIFVGAVLLEQNEAWSTGKLYFDVTEYRESFAEEKKAALSASMLASSELPREEEAAEDCADVRAA
ncbi:MAG: IS110 family transposase [Clostridiales bacterium]|nr:IS110 family transposase [Clostridiales bacterium]